MPTSRDRRVVVTGVGATTPLAGTASETWEALLASRSGARPIDAPWVEEYHLPVTFAATIAQPVEERLTKLEIRRNDPSTQYALVAAREAWADSGIEGIEPERLAVAIGSGIGGVWTLLTQWDTLKERGPRRVFPLAVPMLMPNAPAATVSLALGARAGAHATVSACASGAEGMAYAMELIRLGKADVVVAGGTEAAIHPMPIAGFAAMQALSTRNDDPARASRPWDSARDGFVIGEGSGVLVLEAEEHARARGARIYAELLSAGTSADAFHETAPDPHGMSRAMTEAVASADLAPADIAHINCHATSTPVGDPAEAKAVRLSLGDAADSACVTGTKSMTGHLLGAAGALEALVTVLSLHHRKVPATINVEDVDPEIDLDIVRGEHRALPSGDIAALNNSFGFGGHNVVLCFRSV